jgi:N-acetylglutamate synthase-like GNAT family acetyltransferase
VISIRRATLEDTVTVHELIRGLAEHQGQGWGVTVSVDD